MKSARLFGLVPLASVLLVAAAGLLATPANTHADDPPELTAEEEAAYKAANDTEPRVPLSANDLAGLARKESRVQPRSSPGGISTLAAQYWGRTIGCQYQGQINSYYCGPAAVSEALYIKGISLSQTTAGYELKTDTSGTGFSGVYANVPPQYQTGYPVRDVMNYHLGRTFYYPVWLSYYPSSLEISTYIDRMTTDIDSYYPVIGDAWEVAWGSHLWGHPQNLTIFHWFTISGYGHYGNSSNYMDSAFTVWPSVNGFNWYFDSATLVRILGGRGCMW